MAAVLLGTAGMNALADQYESPSAAGPEKSYTGQIVSVDQQNRMLNVKQSFFSKKQFNLGDKCAYVMVENQNGSPADLRAGEKVTVIYQVSQGVRIADRVEQQAMRFEGTVGAIDPKNNAITLHRPGLDKPMEIGSGCNVLLKDNRSGALKDIQPGDHVTVTYEIPYGMPTARQIAQTSSEFTGTLTAVDLNDQTVKAKDTFSSKKFNVANNCTIMVNGRSDAKLSDLQPNERLTFNYDQVNGVNVVNRIAPANETTQTNNATYTTTPGYQGYQGGY